MKLIITTFFILCTGVLLNANPADTTVTLQQNTIDTLSNFRHDVNTLVSGEIADSLASYATNFIFEVQTMQNAHQLRGIQNYFSKADKILKRAGANTRVKVARNINSDITLKLTPTDSMISTGAFPSTGTAFSKYVNVVVSVIINGVKQTVANRYRLMWATYLSDDVVVKDPKAAEGTSANLNFPYTVNVLLPGRIAFWMQDTQTGIWYKPDIPYKVMEPGDNVEFAFKPF